MYPCYIFDTSSLIELESPDGKGLRRMPEYPGKLFVVPYKVAKEMSTKTAPSDTKNWIANGKYSKFNTVESALFMKIRVQEKMLSDADIEGIVLAYYRKGAYIVEEKKARAVAQSLGIVCLTAKQFWQDIKPPLPGF